MGVIPSNSARNIIKQLQNCCHFRLVRSLGVSFLNISRFVQDSFVSIGWLIYRNSLHTEEHSGNVMIEDEDNNVSQ